MLWAILKPWVLMGFSTGYLIVTVAKLVASGDLRTLLSGRKLGDAWFGNFWEFMGPRSKAEATPWVKPLLEGRVKGGQAGEAAVNSPIEGVVLEVGAGSGMWTQILADVTSSAKAKAINAPTKIYGIEPNPISAAALRRRVSELDLDGTYEVVPVGIEDMHNQVSIAPGSIDCIMTVQCLCSIPEPEKNIQLLYNYLKEGGRWYLYEHVKVEKGFAITFFQKFTDFFWQFMMGSCRLCRPTKDWIVKVGEWDSIDIATRSDESPYAVIPHIVGTLTKSS